MRIAKKTLIRVIAFSLCSAAAATLYGFSASAGWSTEDREMLRSLSLTSLGALPSDPSNKYANDTLAAAFGHRLFFDTRLSGNGKVSCASCHDAERNFQDGLPLGKGVGTTARRTMPIAGTAYSAWQFWDGRSDSQWGQALGPLESAVEHGGDRTQYAHLVATQYRNEYEAIFGKLPDLSDVPLHASPAVAGAPSQAWSHLSASKQGEISRVHANIGKAIAAYERRISFAPSRFDRYVDAELAGRAHDEASAFSADEEAGLKLFIGKANCTNCHNGALFTDNHFHNIAVPSSVGAAPDSGRAVGARQVVAGEFNCTSKYSDAREDQCDELRFAVVDGEELLGAFKTPSLRNVAQRAPYMHAGQFASLADVIRHYSKPPKSSVGHSELKALRLSDKELSQIEAFLHTLSSPLSAPNGYLGAPHIDH